jgi:hypothetical protein
MHGLLGWSFDPDGLAIAPGTVISTLPMNMGPRYTSSIATAAGAGCSRRQGTGIAQYAYQLEAQADVRARIVVAGGTATATDPRQGRNIGLSAILAINDHEFLVLERQPRHRRRRSTGASVVGSKRIFRIDLDGANDIRRTPAPRQRRPGRGGHHTRDEVGRVD